MEAQTLKNKTNKNKQIKKVRQTIYRMNGRKDRHNRQREEQINKPLHDTTDRWTEIRANKLHTNDRHNRQMDRDTSKQTTHERPTQQTDGQRYEQTNYTRTTDTTDRWTERQTNKLNTKEKKQRNNERA